MPNEQVSEIINLLTNPIYSKLVCFVVGLLTGGLIVNFRWSKSIKVDKSKKTNTQVFNTDGGNIIFIDTGQGSSLGSKENTTT